MASVLKWLETWDGTEHSYESTWEGTGLLDICFPSIDFQGIIEQARGEDDAPSDILSCPCTRTVQELVLVGGGGGGERSFTFQT